MEQSISIATKDDRKFIARELPHRSRCKTVYVLGEMSSNSEVGSNPLLGCVHRPDAAFEIRQLAQIPRIAVQCPSHNLLQPANMVAHTVKVVGEMGLKTLLDHGPASSPGMDVKFRSRISPACRWRRELGQPEGSREGPFARQSKSYYYATACSGSRGGAGAQRAPVPSFYSGLFYAPPDSP